MDRLSVEQIVEVCRDFGVEVCPGPGGGGVLRGWTSRLPPQLLEVVRRWRRDDLRKALPSPGDGPEPPAAEPPPEPAAGGTEFLWRTGHRYLRPADGPPVVPAGAWWRRPQGAAGWQVIEEEAHVARVGAESLFRGEHLPPGEHLAGQVPGARRPDAQPADLARRQRGVADAVLQPGGGVYAAGDPFGGGADHE